MSDEQAAERYAGNLKGEVESASLYRTLAEVEKDPRIAGIYRKLAATEAAHAEIWAKRLRALGRKVPPAGQGLRLRLLQWLARRFGPGFVLPTINQLERADSGHYDDQPEARAAGLPAAERQHAQVISSLAEASLKGPGAGGVIGRLEGRHRLGSGNALRAAVLGANDGLVSNLSLVMGVAGAAVEDRAILITGLAGLIAGACSMALGEWLSVNSSREFYRTQIESERQELEESPEEEKEELVLIYQAKGLDEATARALADRLMADRGTALDTLAREELGIDPDELGGSAWVAAASSFALFATGAIFPVAPYFFLTGWSAVIGSLIASAVALAAIGAGTSLFTGRGLLFSAGRQLLVGFAAAAITFGIGSLVGVSVGG